MSCVRIKLLNAAENPRFLLLQLPLHAGGRAGTVHGTGSHHILVLQVSPSASRALDPQRLEGGHLSLEGEMKPFAGIEIPSAKGSPPPSKDILGTEVGYAAMIFIAC